MKLNSFTKAMLNAWLPKRYLMIIDPGFPRISGSLKRQIAMTMKLTTLLLIAGLIQVSAKGFSQKIKLNETNMPLEKVLHAIESQTSYVFFFDAKLVKQNVTVKISDATITDALSACLKGSALTFQIADKTIFIKKREQVPVPDVVAVNQKIRGRVVDADGATIPGVTVKVKNTGLSVLTDSRGEFTLTVPDNAVLVVSSIGYESRELAVPDQGHLTVVLQPSVSKLDEVQIVAYGTTTERLNTGNVGTIRAADIEKQPVNNILDALIGRIAGLQITQSSGIQGAAPKVQIRGQNSISTGTAPLYILDGVPINETQALNYQGGLDNQGLNLLTSLNTADIESVNVLKDADATAIYGSRGANGVILITTKRGKAGNMVTTLNASTGFQQVGNFIHMLDADQYIALRTKAFADDNVTPTIANAPDLLSWDKNNVHDWQKEFIGKTAISNDLSLSFSGGNENTKYYISGGYHKEGTVMPGDSKMIRSSFMSTVNNTSKNKKFNIEVRTGYSLNTLNLLPTDLVTSIFLPPHYPIYNQDGSPNWSVTTFPLSYTLQKYAAPTKNFSGNALMSYEFIRGLKLKLTGGFNSTILNMSQESPLYSKNPLTATSGTLIKQDINNNNWILEPQLEYNVSLKKHHIAALVGATYQEKNSSSVTLIGSNFPNDNLISNISSAGTINTGSVNTPYTYDAIFGRISYDFNQELLTNVTFRRDGSSRFGDGHKFGNFGAVGLGWIFSQREWIKDELPFLSYGKLRGSYGITGNDQITDFKYLNTYTSVSTGYNGSSALQPSGIANPELRWETTKKLEAALELGFLKDRFLLTGAFFRNRSDNQLVSNNVSPQTGFYSYTANFPGLVQNQGIEIELNTKNIRGAFSWNTSLTFSKSNNKLLRFDNIASSSYSQTLAVGQSLTLIQAYEFKGLNAKGVPVFADLDGNGIINSNDRVFAGNSDPEYGGMSNDFSYKGFSFSFFIRYDRVRRVPLYIPSQTVGSFDNNFSTYVLNRWQNPGDEANTVIPRATTSFSLYSNFNYLQSDQLISTRNIFRISNAALSYNLPSSLISGVGISRLKVFVNGQNLYVFDKHKSEELDPQTGNNSLPALRTIVFGINASF